MLPLLIIKWCNFGLTITGERKASSGKVETPQFVTSVRGNALILGF